MPEALTVIMAWGHRSGDRLLCEVGGYANCEQPPARGRAGQAFLMNNRRSEDVYFCWYSEQLPDVIGYTRGGMTSQKREFAACRG